MSPSHHSPPPVPRSLVELTRQLRDRSVKITGARQAILDVLRRQAHPATTRQILAALPAGECDLATVYRSMHLLERMGLVQRFNFGDGRDRFELRRDDPASHHHHLVCTRCARIVEIHQCFPSQLEAEIAARNGYTQVTHRLEFFGLCPACQ